MSPLTSDSPADDTNGPTDGNAATNAGAWKEQAGCFRFSLRGMPQIIANFYPFIACLKT